MSDFIEHSSKLGRGRSPRSEENREIFVLFPEGTQDAELVTAWQIKPQATGARRREPYPRKTRPAPTGHEKACFMPPSGLLFLPKGEGGGKGQAWEQSLPQRETFWGQR